MLAPPPVSASRRVRQLQISASSPDDGRRVATAVADALHTASMPFAERGRLVVIRRLDLGRVSARANSVSLSLRLESALQEILWEAISFDASGADRASVVTFPDRASALAVLARRLATGLPVDDWFWESIVPGWRSCSSSERWIFLLCAAQSTEPAALCVASVFAEAVRAGQEREFLAQFAAGAGRAWLKSLGWEYQDRMPPIVHLPALPILQIERLLRTWGCVDDRLVWIAVMLLVHKDPWCAEIKDLPEQVYSALKQIFFANDANPGASSSAESKQIEQRGSSPLKDQEGDAPSTLGRIQSKEQLPALQNESIDAERNVLPLVLDGTATEFAGLFFLVRILQHLSFPEFLSASPQLLEGGFGARLLLYVGERVGLKPGDPLAIALLPDAEIVLEPGPFPYPAPLNQLFSSPPPRCPLENPFDVWLAATRRWCRLQGRIGLINLIRRPGTIAFSPTQLDVSLPLKLTDARLRRLGLDIDPGWVPWLGRIVKYHYVDQHQSAC
jgi:hypothetical protein